MTSGAFEEFDRYCIENGIEPGEEPAAFAAWLNDTTGWDGKMTEVVAEPAAEPVAEGVVEGVVLGAWDPAPERGFPDWFTGGHAEANFIAHLLPLAGVPGLRFLQIGAYAGDATRWLMRHVLTHPTSSLVDVDTWGGSPETFMRSSDFTAVKAYYDARLPDGVHVRQMTSETFFGTAGTGLYHFVYVDGAHDAQTVLADAVSAYRVLKRGGILAFDDYQWADPLRPDWDRPATAIDAFESVYRDKVKLIVDGYQRWYQKLG